MAGESPCLTCKRAKVCGEGCNAYKKWFPQKWEEMQIAYGVKQRIIEIVRPTDDYIMVGGHKYYHPDTVRKRMEERGLL